MKRGTPLLFLALLLQYCGSTFHAYSDYVKGTDFTKYKTYAWLPDADTSHGKPIFNNEILRKNLHMSVNGELASLGFKLDTIKPDVLVLVHTNFERKQELVKTPLYSSYPYYYPGFYPGPWYPYYYPGFYNYTFITGYDIHQVEFTQGSIVIDLIDRSSRNLVWRGWSEQSTYDPAEITRQLPHIVHEIMRKYPTHPSDEVYQKK